MIPETITGNYTLVADPKTWRMTNNEEVRLNCDTSGGPVNITLPPIADLLGFYNVKIFVVDKNNTAGTNPINVLTSGGNTLNGQPTQSVNTNGGAAIVQVADADNWEFDSVGDGAVAETLVMPLIAPQIVSAPAGDFFDDTQFVAVPGLQLTMPASRTRSVAFCLSANSLVGTGQIQLWNDTDGVQLGGLINVPVTANPQSYSSPAITSALNKGDVIKVRVKPALGGSISLYGGGGLGEGDFCQFVLATDPYAEVVNEVGVTSIGYVKKASIGILNALSAGTFSMNVMSSYNRSVPFDNFGGVVLTEANANVAPTLVTATTIKSDVGTYTTALAPVTPLAEANRLAIFTSIEAWAQNL